MQHTRRLLLASLMLLIVAGIATPTEAAKKKKSSASRKARAKNKAKKSPKKKSPKASKASNKKANSPETKTLLALHNAERKSAKAPALKLNAKLTAAAQKYAEYLKKSGKFSHTAKGSPATRIKAEGYKYSACGENIAKGQKDAAGAVRGWMKSPGHKRNILNKKYRDVGFGICGKLRVAVFAKSR